MFAFINLQPEGQRLVMARLDQIASVEVCDTIGLNGTKVTLTSGATLTGSRDVREFKDAMFEAGKWLDEDDGA